MFWHWWKFDQGFKLLVWQHYGRFTLLMVAGSFFGILSSLCFMQTFVFNYEANIKYKGFVRDFQAEIQRAYAASGAWQSAYFVFYSLSFAALHTAQLMIIHRVIGFSDILPFGVSIRDGTRFVIGFVTVGNFIGFCGYVAAAWFSGRAASLNAQAADAWEADPDPVNSTRFADISVEYGQEYRKQAVAESVKRFSEVSVLLMIILTFTVSGVLAMRRLRAAQDSRASTAAFAKKLRLKVVATIAVVFCTFLLRACLSIMLAVSGALANFDAECKLCSTCFNMYTNMTVWIHFTPEFETLIILISAPLASLVALWGMTSERMMGFIRFNKDNQRQYEDTNTLPSQPLTVEPMAAVSMTASPATVDSTKLPPRRNR
jgi:hypothetical protein